MASNVKNILLRWLPAFAWMAIIFWFSSQPDLPRPASNILNLIMRKSAHFGVYAVLALCYLYGLQRGELSPRIALRRYGAALLLALLYAISDEYHQSWTPNRHPAVTDILIDTAGALTGLALWGRFGNILLRLYWQQLAATD
jgi:VanZ family protein